MKGKKKLYKLIGILSLITSILLVIIFALEDSFMGVFISIIILLVATIMLNHWSSISYIWTCEVCGEIRILSVKENFIYINIGIDRKYFHCNECGVKRIFNGKYKY